MNRRHMFNGLGVIHHDPFFHKQLFVLPSEISMVK